MSDQRTVSWFWVDAFAQRPYEGNPAAVCLLERNLEDAEGAQALAAELGISETAFVGPPEDGRRELRWFTPTTEVDLCGHATLAATHALAEIGAVGPGREVAYATRSGTLRARTGAGPDGSLIELDFPARPPEPREAPEGLLESLGLAARFVGLSGENDWLVEVDSVDFVLGCAPDLDLLSTVEARGAIVTAAGGPDDELPSGPGGPPDFVSRFFAPRAGVPEDPVTGSAHCTLAPFWGGRLRRDRMVGYQASARGGHVSVGLDGDRVALAGGAVTIARGELGGSALGG